MKVSIITVVYNAVRTIEQTIKSVLCQSYKNIEYIIIDGGSTDGTLDVIAKYRDILAYFVSEPDGGIYDAMNKGIKKATGDIIGLLNADDWYEPNAIEAVVKGFEYSAADVVYGKMILINKDGTKKNHERKTPEMLLESMCLPHPATFLRKETYEKYGLFDTSFRIAADYELMLRLYVNGASFFAVDDILTNFRMTGVSNTGFITLAQENLKIHSIYNANYPNKEKILEKMNYNLLAAKVRSLCIRYSSVLPKLLDLLNIKGSVVIWGTGRWGRQIYDVFSNNQIEVLYFVDSDESKWESSFNEITIKSPVALKKYSGLVFIAVKDYDLDIAQKLESMGNPSLRYVLLRDFVNKAAPIYDELNGS